MAGWAFLDDERDDGEECFHGVRIGVECESCQSDRQPRAATHMPEGVKRKPLATPTCLVCGKSTRGRYGYHSPHRHDER